MKHVTNIVIIVAGILFLANVIKWVIGDNRPMPQEEPYNGYTRIMDSLEIENEILVSTIDSLQAVIDSLNEVKQKIIIKYDKQIEDFSDPCIVDDDSITSYISNQINARQGYSGSVHDGGESNNSYDAVGERESDTGEQYIIRAIREWSGNDTGSERNGV